MKNLKSISLETLPLNFPFWKASDDISRATKKEASFPMDLCGQALCVPQKLYKPIRPSFFLTVMGTIP